MGAGQSRASEEWSTTPLYSAIVEERQRLARALHDGPVQALTAAVLQAGLCRHLAEQGDLVRLDQSLAQLIATLERGSLDIRQIMSNLRQASPGGEQSEDAGPAIASRPT